MKKQPMNHSYTDSRYKRQIMMPEIGAPGQERLRRSRVLVVGAGGLGSPLLMYLAAAGVGHIAIADFDVVEESNLNRQILHGTADIGRAKVDSAIETLRGLNPDVVYASHRIKVTEENLGPLTSECDLVLDAVDSFGAKFIINDTCVGLKLPFVHAGATGLKGQLYLYHPGQACLRCLFPTLPGTVAPPLGLGILGATAGVIGTRQALLAIRYLLGLQTDFGELLAFDGATMRETVVRIPRSDSCPVCAI